MKHNIFYFILLSLCTCLLSCTQEKAEDGKTLARINDYNLSLDTFQREMAAELEMDEDFKLTDDAKKDFLERLIRKELLIQEAKRLKLDREERFVRAIERYWESTLIKNLMELKAKDISKKTYISENEIQKRYNMMKGSKEAFPPIEELHERIRKQLLDKKKSRVLKEWVDALRRDADIKINKELLNKE